MLSPLEMSRGSQSRWGSGQYWASARGASAPSSPPTALSSGYIYVCVCVCVCTYLYMVVVV